MYIPNNNIESTEYWEHCDRIIKMAENLGIFMGLLPSWGSLIKNKIITETNIVKFAKFLAERYKSFINIIWILGGDIRAEGYENIYNTLGNTLKKANEDRLITSTHLEDVIPLRGLMTLIGWILICFNQVIEDISGSFETMG